jgi:hypothetical protein
MDQNTLTKKDAQKWANELRSGLHEQGRNTLEDEDGRLCCLGLACKIFIPENKQKISDGVLKGFYPINQPNAPTWLRRIDAKLNRKLGSKLSYLNDRMDYSFDEIADLIELVYVHEALN